MKETIAIIQKCPTEKSLGPDRITSESYQTLKEKLTLILLKYFKGEESRWQRNRTGRSLSLLQIH